MAKNVVITGATSGIGEAIARAYLEKGENIVLTGRRIERSIIISLSFTNSSGLGIFLKYALNRLFLAKKLNT